MKIVLKGVSLVGADHMDGEENKWSQGKTIKGALDL
jgi:hypothetical protein